MSDELSLSWEHIWPSVASLVLRPTHYKLKEALIKYDRLSACRGFGRALLGQTADRLTACRT